MQQLSQLSRQLLDIWRQLGLNQRISVAVAALAVFGGLVALAVWSSRTDYVLLYGRLDDAEAAKIVAVLNDAKIPYRAGAGAVYVPADKVHAMRMQMAAKGIRKNDDVGFEILEKANFGISDFMQRATYLRALQGELARTISQMEEVEAARVMVALPEHRLLTDNSRRPKASVFLRLKGQGVLPAHTISAMQTLVANSVEGLVPANVSVMDSRGNPLSSDQSEPNSLLGLSATQFAIRKELELYLAKKVETMLEPAVGIGQAKVRVAVEINAENQVITREKFDPEGQVMRSSTIKDITSDTLSAAVQGGVPGVSANANTESTNLLAAAPGNKALTKTKENTTQYEIDKTTSNITQMAGGLKRVTAAVLVAARQTGAGTNRTVVARTPEELQKLRRIVQGALGVADEAARKEDIALEEMPFTDAFAPESIPPLAPSGVGRWLETARPLITPALALVVLFAFWRALRKSTAESMALGGTVGDLGRTGQGNGNGRKPTSGNGNGNGHSSADQPADADAGVLSVAALNQLVRENPDNMSQAIKVWLARSRAPQE